jgi:hypothetical protein
MAGKQEELSPADKLKAETAAKIAKASDDAVKALENEPGDAEQDAAALSSGTGSGIDAAAEVFAAEASRNEDDRVAKMQRGEEAAKKLRLIAIAYPMTTPNEHTIFGFGGHRFVLGDLRDLFMLPKP